MSDQPLHPAPLAYLNDAFVNGPDGRILRILSEYQEPLTRFRREQIQDTVVFFGSARLQSPENAAAKLQAVHAGLSGTEPVVRVYTEARTQADAEKLTASAKQWIFE
jgi:phosphomannomutase